MRPPTSPASLEHMGREGATPFVPPLRGLHTLASGPALLTPAASCRAAVGKAGMPAVKNAGDAHVAVFGHAVFLNAVAHAVCVAAGAPQVREPTTRLGATASASEMARDLANTHTTTSDRHSLSAICARPGAIGA